MAGRSGGRCDGWQVKTAHLKELLLTVSEALDGSEKNI